MPDNENNDVVYDKREILDIELDPKARKAQKHLQLANSYIKSIEGCVFVVVAIPTENVSEKGDTLMQMMAISPAGDVRGDVYHALVATAVSELGPHVDTVNRSLG